MAQGLGLTEALMVGLAMGRTSRQHKPVLSLLFHALMLLELWAGKPVHTVAAKVQVQKDWRYYRDELQWVQVS